MQIENGREWETLGRHLGDDLRDTLSDLDGAQFYDRWRKALSILNAEPSLEALSWHNHVAYPTYKHFFELVTISTPLMAILILIKYQGASSEFSRSARIFPTRHERSFVLQVVCARTRRLCLNAAGTLIVKDYAF